MSNKKKKNNHKNNNSQRETTSNSLNAEVKETIDEEKELEDKEFEDKKEITADETAESSEQDSEDTTSSDEESSNSDDETKSASQKMYIIEAIVAVLAIAVIIFAIVKTNKNNTDSVSNNSVSADASINQSGMDDYTMIDIDNSALFENIPAVPVVDEFNTITLEECEQALADDTMIKLATSTGNFIYVNNYNNKALFDENTVVDSADIDKYIQEDLLYYYGEMVDADHDIAQNGDTVSVNYVGKIDGVAFEGGSADDYIELGAGNYIPGFEEGIVGMQVGEVKDITVPFPEDYMATDLAGKEAVFTITLNGIMTMQYPELTDEIVQENFSDMTTAAECREYYEKMITQEKIWNFLAENYYVDSLPSEIVTDYYNTTMNYYDMVSQSYQLPIADLLVGSYESMDDFKADVIAGAAETSRYSIFYLAIAEDLGLSVTDDDIAELATMYGYDDIEAFLNDYGRQTVYDYLYQTEILDKLYELNK